MHEQPLRITTIFLKHTAMKGGNSLFSVIFSSIFARFSRVVNARFIPIVWHSILNTAQQFLMLQEKRTDTFDFNRIEMEHSFRDNQRNAMLVSDMSTYHLQLGNIHQRFTFSSCYHPSTINQNYSLNMLRNCRSMEHVASRHRHLSEYSINFEIIDDRKWRAFKIDIYQFAHFMVKNRIYNQLNNLVNNLMFGQAQLRFIAIIHVELPFIIQLSVGD